MAYGYGYSDGYASYYSVPPPGGYLDAASYLDGPGTHAYLADTSRYGTHYTSYASESDRGGIYRRGTTTYSQGTVTTSATYDYSGGGYAYHRSVNTFTPSQPMPAGDGFGYYAAGYDIPNHLETYRYSSFQTETDQVGAYRQFEEQIFSLTSYTDGSSVSYYSERSQELTSDGHTVPGTISSYGVSGFNYGDGYTTYIQR